MIEDIDYLKKHSMKESYILLIDSKNRDKSVHRTPENYKIDFESPFTHVYSVEVLDASIPRTQYSVDEHNNKLRLNAYYDNDKGKYSDSAKFIDLTIPIGDYNDTTLITKVNDILNVNNIDMLLRNVSSPSNVKSTFEFVSPHKFELDMHSSTLNTVLGFDMYNVGGESGKYANYKEFIKPVNYESDFITDTRYSTIFKNRWFGSILSQTDTVTFTGYESPTNLGDTYTDTDTGSGSVTLIQPFKIDNDLYISGYLENFNIEILSGNYINIVIKNEKGDAVEIIDTTITPLNESSNYQAHITFTSDFTVNVNTGVEPIKAVTNKNGNELKVNESNFELNFEVILHKKLHKVVAPGMHNLLGERYLMLRCKEIEDHLFKFRAYESYSMGMAKFKLSVQGFEDERFDFSSIPPREFHPIGKLPCLSFEFLNPDGSYYNFRGINHTLTLIIRYYTPTQDPTLFKSKLNPEYDPDIFKYIQEKGFNTDSDNDSDSVSDN